MLPIWLSSCAVSACVLLFCLFYLRELHRQRRHLTTLIADQEHQLTQQRQEIERLLAELAEKKASPQLATDAQQLLHDMTAHGNAVVRIIPISPADLFYRSPR